MCQHFEKFSVLFKHKVSLLLLWSLALQLLINYLEFRGGGILVLREACPEKELSENPSRLWRMCRIQKGHEWPRCGGWLGKQCEQRRAGEWEGCEASIRCPLSWAEGLPRGRIEHVFGWIRRLTQGRSYHRGGAWVLHLEREKLAFPLFKTRGFLRKMEVYLWVQMSTELKCFIPLPFPSTVPFFQVRAFSFPMALVASSLGHRENKYHGTTGWTGSILPMLSSSTMATVAPQLPTTSLCASKWSFLSLHPSWLLLTQCLVLTQSTFSQKAVLSARCWEQFHPPFPGKWLQNSAWKLNHWAIHTCKLVFTSIIGIHLRWLKRAKIRTSLLMVLINFPLTICLWTACVVMKGCLFWHV